jgi:hypothetical protein
MGRGWQMTEGIKIGDKVIPPGVYKVGEPICRQCFRELYFGHFLICWLSWNLRNIKESFLCWRKTLSQWCKPEENYPLVWWERIFYSLKGLYCLSVGRHWNKKYGSYPDEVIVSILRGGSFSSQDCMGTCYWWTEFVVGHGIFSGWFYVVQDDQSC